MIAIVAFLFLHQQIPPQLKAISNLASALSEGNALSVMSMFDKSLPNYETISANVQAMTAQADITCSIDPVDQNGDEVEVDWFLMLRSKEESGPTERRQMKVKLTLTKSTKGYKIASVNPPSILDAPNQ